MQTHKLAIELLVLALVMSAIVAMHASAQSPINVITTATPFLRLSADARAAGMAETGLATTPDAGSGAWNPAKLPFNPKKGGLSAGYSPWLRELAGDLYLTSLAGYYRLDTMQAIHGELRYFSLGGIQFTDEYGNKLQSLRPREWSITAGYSRKLSERAGLGVSIRLIHSNLASKGILGNDYKAATAFAMDLAYYYRALNSAGHGWSFGGALTNLGSRIAYTTDAQQKSFIPANLGIGTAYTTSAGNEHQLCLGVDINKLLVPTPPASGDSAAMVHYTSNSVLSSWFRSFSDAPSAGEELRECQLSAGAEYSYQRQFFLRTGYFWEDKTKGHRQYASLGAGLKYQTLQFNFAWLIPTGSGININPLSNTLRFGLVLDINQ